jgi:hypothetical protein
MPKPKEYVYVVWNGTGGELDRVKVEVKTEHSAAIALVKMIGNNIVTPGDTFVIERA